VPEATNDVPAFSDFPVGIHAQRSRSEFDSLGSFAVPARQRSLVHFSIGNDQMPIEVSHACGLVKRPALSSTSARADWPVAGEGHRPDGRQGDRGQPRR
jgi:fumarate hydratase, class II